MSAVYNPRTLAKTIAYISYHAAAEHGLFWDGDGTMPWRELYWALQEDPSLRFVRESHVKEILYLGLSLPFTLDGNRIRLNPDVERPAYLPAMDLPGRLYYACRAKRIPHVRESGLFPANRSFVPLSSEKNAAMRIGKRRDPSPILLEILAADALRSGLTIFQAGLELYLAEHVPPSYLHFPLMKADLGSKPPGGKTAGKQPPRREIPAHAGSFFVGVQHLGPETSGAEVPVEKAEKRGKKGSDWKRGSRKERLKRTL